MDAGLNPSSAATFQLDSLGMFECFWVHFLQLQMDMLLLTPRVVRLGIFYVNPFI